MNVNKKVEYRYLKLSDDLQEVGKLIYNADPYIYPAFFGNEDNASILITEAIKRKLYYFCIENIFGVFDEGKPIAIMCKKQAGKYKWNYTEWKNLFIEMQLAIPNSFEHVALNHFIPTNEEKLSDEIHIFSVCVSPNLRNQGIGHKMLQRFISLHSSEELVLDVLINNEAAIALYKSVGFQEAGHYMGYNVIDPRPRCIHMIKKS